MVGLDPGYDLEDVPLMGCIIEPCRTGQWSVREYSELVSKRVPGPVVALHSSVVEAIEPNSPRWQKVRDDISGDGGIEGVYDMACFGKADVIPKGHKPNTVWADIPSRHWYSYICDVVLAQEAQVVVHPFGCTLHWDLGVAVSALKDAEGKVVGVLLTPY